MIIQGTVNMSATYNTRNHDVESSVVARGDLWRLEASRSGSTSGNDSSPLYLVQLGPLLFVRDSTLLLPVHLSKQHLLWYGYDRKVLISFPLPSPSILYLFIHYLYWACVDENVIFCYLHIICPECLLEVMFTFAEWSAFPLSCYLVKT